MDPDGDIRHRALAVACAVAADAVPLPVITAVAEL